MRYPFGDDEIILPIIGCLILAKPVRIRRDSLVKTMDIRNSSKKDVEAFLAYLGTRQTSGPGLLSR